MNEELHKMIAKDIVEEAEKHAIIAIGDLRGVTRREEEGLTER